MAGVLPRRRGRRGARAAHAHIQAQPEIRVPGSGPAKVTVLIEPLNPRDMPRYLLGAQAEAHAIREELGHGRTCALQMDLYHAQVVEGDLTTKIRRWLPYIGHIQVAGVPDRDEPNDGELNYSYLFKLLDELQVPGLDQLRVSSRADDRRRASTGSTSSSTGGRARRRIEQTGRAAARTHLRGRSHPIIGTNVHGRGRRDCIDICQTSIKCGRSATFSAGHCRPSPPSGATPGESLSMSALAIKLIRHWLVRMPVRNPIVWGSGVRTGVARPGRRTRNRRRHRGLGREPLSPRRHSGGA